jgi:hypothetical protein
LKPYNIPFFFLVIVYFTIFDFSINMNDWVTVGYYVSPVEMAVLKDRFDAEEIVFFTSGENSAYPPISAVQGGIKLQVRENDKERALEIMKESGYLE